MYLHLLGGKGILPETEPNLIAKRFLKWPIYRGKHRRLKRSLPVQNAYKNASKRTVTMRKSVKSFETLDLPNPFKTFNCRRLPKDLRRDFSALDCGDGFTLMVMAFPFHSVCQLNLTNPAGYKCDFKLD